MIKKITIFLVLVLFSAFGFAQRGKSGSLTVASSIKVNEYTTLTANANAGSNIITVANSNLNANGRFPGNLAKGDLLMIIQMQGANIKGQPWVSELNWGFPRDSSWGTVTAYNDCGNHEFAEVDSVISLTSIKLDCGLQFNYADSGRVQIVRVPRYTSLTINNGGTITCDNWDSAKGGIVAIEVLNNTVINAGGAINATGAGFRGARYNGEDSTGFGSGEWAGRIQTLGKEKGEGIAGYEWKLAEYGGKECQASAANAGGGGDANNGGGGGGANGGVVANWINGFGNPDVSTANYITCWNKEYTWMSSFTASGGGRGGYTFSNNSISPLTNGPGAGGWGGDNRRSVGGRGGRPLDYSTGRIFMAGGGGAGDQNNGYGGGGGAGGGIIYLVSYGTVSGSGQMIANGNTGINASGVAPFGGAAGIDGAGGGGGGGTIIVNSVGNISGVSLTANGGNGGNQVVTWNFSTDPQSEGPGGGGGGGYIATSNAGPVETANGGVNGTTNGRNMTQFPPNGATKGGVGTTGAVVSNFYIVANNDTICSGQQATLSASLVGTVPGGTVIEWYTLPTGGSPVGSGSPFTTPALFSNTTYYVSTCPGTYRQAVNVIISGSAVTTITPNSSICKGQNIGLNATGGTAYSWAPAATLSNPNISNPTATPTVTTTYTCSITTACGIQKDSVKITVNPLPAVTLSATSNPICVGGSSTLTANGGSTYLWSTGATTSSISVTPPSTATYTVHITSALGCTKDTTLTVIVNPLPSVTLSASNNPICAGSNTTLTANGGNTYLWSTGATTSSISVAPLSTITYTVHVTSAAGCTKDTTLTVTVNPLPSVTLSASNNPICAGSNTTLTANGGNTYLWSTGATTSSINVAPASNTTYTVHVTSAAGCTKDTTIAITVNPLPTVTISTSKDTLCGDSAVLTATGGTSYLWSPAASLSNPNIANPTATPAVTTTYTVQVTALGCSKDTTITIVSFPTPTVTVSPLNPSICNGGSVNLVANGAVTYTWAPATGLTCTNCSNPTANPSSTTTYTVIGRGTSGPCADTAFVTVTVGTLIANVTGVDTICKGNSTTLSASGGTSYTWSTGATTSSINVSPASTITYTVVASSGNCTDTVNYQVVVNPLPIASITGNNSICNGDSTWLKATGGGTYTWSNASTADSINVKPIRPTIYSVTVTKNGCSVTVTDTIMVNAKPVPVISPINDSICQGAAIQFNASGGTTYTWSPAAGLSAANVANPIATPSSTTEYTVVVANGGCTALDSILIVVKPDPPITATAVPTIIVSGTQSILNVTPGATYSWTPSSTLSCNTCQSPTATPTVTTWYYVTVTQPDGCSARDSVLVTVDDKCKQVFVPNAFSPNGDGQNDVLYVKGDCIETMQLDIYDRWGNKVFTSQNVSDGWDGTYKGKTMDAATFMYTFSASMTDGTTVNQKGSITLIK